MSFSSAGYWSVGMLNDTVRVARFRKGQVVLSAACETREHSSSLGGSYLLICFLENYVLVQFTDTNR